MSKYRINVRFDLGKPKEANAAQYLQALDKSRNAFMYGNGGLKRNAAADIRKRGFAGGHSAGHTGGIAGGVVCCGTSCF